jgi:hypothetical protein
MPYNATICFDTPQLSFFTPFSAPLAFAASQLTPFRATPDCRHFASFRHYAFIFSRFQPAAISFDDEFSRGFSRFSLYRQLIFFRYYSAADSHYAFASLFTRHIFRSPPLAATLPRR